MVAASLTAQQASKCAVYGAALPATVLLVLSCCTCVRGAPWDTSFWTCATIFAIVKCFNHLLVLDTEGRASEQKGIGTRVYKEYAFEGTSSKQGYPQHCNLLITVL